MAQVESQADARLIAAKLLEQHEVASGIPVAIMDDHTRSFDDGWLFFYNSVEFIETGKFGAQLAGNCPIFVMTSGAVHELPTYQSPEASLAVIRTKSG